MTTAIQDAFNAGEICEEALSRKDIAQAAKVVRLGLNGFFITQGGWRRRKGTWFVAAPRTGGGDYLLCPFTRASGQSVMLELGCIGSQGYGRVYGLDRQRVGTVEFNTPFTQDELPDGLAFLQSGDGLIVVRRNGKRLNIIVRSNTLIWACNGYAVINGPLEEEYAGDGANLTIGTTTLTSDKPIFKAGHVGAQIRIKHEGGYSPADGWRSGWKAAAGEVGYYAGNYYQVDTVATKKTGFLPPVHTSGSRMDGNAAAGEDSAGRNWRYLHDGSTFGIVQGFNNANSVNIGWQTELCTPIGSKTKYFTWSAYNDALGWPTMAPCVREKRIVMGATLSHPDTIDLTRTNGWSLLSMDFKPGMGSGLVVADDAMRLLIGGNGASLKWAVEMEAMFVASTDALFSVTGGGVDAPLKPDSVLVREIPGGGSSAVLPCKTPKSILYAPPSRRGLIELSGSNGDYSVSEISLLFQHITGLGIAQVLYMRSPWHQIVLRLDDGSVAFVNYNREQNVLAAARQDFGGRVFTLAVVAGADGEDQLWLGIDRGGVRSTEVMSGFYENMFLDGAQIFTGGATSAIGDLDRYNGQMVQMWADGVWHENRPVTAGVAYLRPGEVGATIVTGLGYTSRLEFMPLGDSPEAWADQRFRPERIRLTARYTVCWVGTTDDEGGDNRMQKNVNRGENGKWVEKRKVEKLPLSSTTAFDKRIVVQVVNAPYDLLVYSAKVEVAK